MQPETRRRSVQTVFSPLLPAECCRVCVEEKPKKKEERRTERPVIEGIEKPTADVFLSTNIPVLILILKVETVLCQSSFKKRLLFHFKGMFWYFFSFEVAQFGTKCDVILQHILGILGKK